jgi:hypothetical protein
MDVSRKNTDVSRVVFHPLSSKLEIQEKLRLVTFHATATQRKCTVKTGSHQFRRNESSRDLDSKSIKVKTLIA